MRQEALAGDLKQCGISQPGIDQLAIDSDHGSLLGWSYVLEGSRLGADMILRAIDRPGRQVTQATRFLRHGDGERLGRSYKVALSAIDSDPTAISRACVAAKLAFHCFLKTGDR